MRSSNCSSNNNKVVVVSFGGVLNNIIIVHITTKFLLFPFFSYEILYDESH